MLSDPGGRHAEGHREHFQPAQRVEGPAPEVRQGGAPAGPF